MLFKSLWQIWHSKMTVVGAWHRVGAGRAWEGGGDWQGMGEGRSWQGMGRSRGWQGMGWGRDWQSMGWSRGRQSMGRGRGYVPSPYMYSTPLLLEHQIFAFSSIIAITLLSIASYRYRPARLDVLENSTLFPWTSPERAIVPLTGFSGIGRIVSFVRFKLVNKWSIPRKFFILYIFWRDRMQRPLLCLYRPFIIFEGCLDSNPECWRSKPARYRLSHPSL